MDDDAYKRFVKQLNLTHNDSRIGLAVVLGITSSHGPQGTFTDVQEISRVFIKLNFAVLPIHNPTSTRIDEAMKYASSDDFIPDNFKYTVVYYAGHGGNNARGKFIMPFSKTAEPYYIQESIISKFVSQRKHHLFFFDCCLTGCSSVSSTASRGSDTLQDSEDTQDDVPLFIPPHGTFLVAYSTSLNEPASGDTFRGGKWTRELCNNIEKYDLPITLILDKTWDDLVTKESGNRMTDKIQKPHYVSSVGLLSLRGKVPEYFKNLFDSFERPIPLPNEKQPAPEPIVIEPEYDIEDVLRKRPDHPDLETAMERTFIGSDKEQWHWFGELLYPAMRDRWSHYRYTFNRFLEVALKDKPTLSWGDVLSSLTQSTKDGKGHPITVTVDKEKKDCDALLRCYLAQDDICAKYGPRHDAKPN